MGSKVRQVVSRRIMGLHEGVSEGFQDILVGFGGVYEGFSELSRERQWISRRRYRGFKEVLKWLSEGLRKL